MKETGSGANELTIRGLLSLKVYERPDESRMEKNMQNIMRRVRQENNLPAFLLFPEQGFSWAFAQPRYGVAALFLLFFTLHLVNRPVPTSPGSSPSLINSPLEQEIAVMGALTNRTERPAIPGMPQRALYRPPVQGDVRSVLTSFSEP